VAAGFAAPNKDVPEAAAGVDVAAGVAVWPKSPPEGAADEVAAGFAAPKRPPVVGFASPPAGGRPAGVVDPKAPKVGFAGVDWFPPRLPNRLPPEPPDGVVTDPS
jgi:hypothetical protein